MRGFLSYVAGAAYGRIRAKTISQFPNTRLRRIPGASPVDLDDLRKIEGIDSQILNLDANEYLKLLEVIYPDWSEAFESPFYKKLIELSVSAKLLQIGSSDVYMDAAGGLYTYVGRVAARKKILQDRFVSPALKARLSSDGVEFLESSADRIALPDGSVDKISCHHSFEHFRGDADTGFIREINRLLSRRGRACLVPLHLGKAYLEITDDFRMPKQDPISKRVYDPTSPLPGGRFSGRFARIYDITAFQRRVLEAVRGTDLKATIFEIRMQGQAAPDPTLPCHRTDPRIDFPYRAFVLERRN